MDYLGPAAVETYLPVFYQAAGGKFAHDCKGSCAECQDHWGACRGSSISFLGSKLLTHHWCGPSVDDIALVHMACNVHDGQGRCGMDGLIQGLKKLPGAILRQLPIRCEALF